MPAACAPALWITYDDIIDAAGVYSWGLTITEGGYVDHPTPGGIDSIQILRGNLQQDLSPDYSNGPPLPPTFTWNAYGRIPDFMQALQMHEIGHAMSIEHHSDSWDPGWVIQFPWPEFSMILIDYCYSFDPWAPKFNDMVYLWDQMGANACVMRYNDAEIWASISGDDDINGWPSGSETPDPSWDRVMVQDIYCDPSITDPDDIWGLMNIFDCLRTLAISDREYHPLDI